MIRQVIFICSLIFILCVCLARADIDIDTYTATDNSWENEEVYVLRLEEDKCYVGKTSNLQRRLQEHFTGRGSEWTTLHPPVEAYDVKKSTSPYHENQVTLEMMEKYGINNVRGAAYTQRLMNNKPSEIN